MSLSNLIYTLLQWTWGLPQNIVGLIVFLLNRENPHFSYKGSIVTVWADKKRSASLGMFIFLSYSYFEMDTDGNLLVKTSLVGREKQLFEALKDYPGAASDGDKRLIFAREKATRRMRRKELIYILDHEFGHTIQSIILGPLYLLVIGVPSYVWANANAFSRYRVKNKVSYYEFFPEKWANKLGKRR